jgi:hypothetical protein
MSGKDCGKECETYRLIKNPFVCKTSAPVRLTLDKTPLMKTGNTQYIRTATLHNGNKKMINELDPKLSYDFGIEVDDTQYTGISKYDYEIPAEVLNGDKEETHKHYHKKGLPLSFINITTEEEGIEWYSLHYPKIPTDLLPIIARYHWGEPITKKAVKNEKKKIEKKLNKEGLKIENKKIELSFD